MEKLIRVLVVLGLVAVGGMLLVRFFVLHAFRIPTGGMSPTYDVGSHLIANHFDRDPERGKVIVFPFPEHPDKDFVQRIIGVGGDAVTMKSGHPWINGWEVPNCRVGTYDHLSEGDVRHSEMFVEFLGKNTFLVSIEPRPTPEVATWTMKPDHVFTVGDNRMHSYDSRLWPSQAGVDVETIWGGVTASSIPTLPADASALKSALDACLAKRPAKTIP